MSPFLRSVTQILLSLSIRVHFFPAVEHVIFIYLFIHLYINYFFHGLDLNTCWVLVRCYVCCCCCYYTVAIASAFRPNETPFSLLFTTLHTQSLFLRLFYLLRSLSLSIFQFICSFVHHEYIFSTSICYFCQFIWHVIRMCRTNAYRIWVSALNQILHIERIETKIVVARAGEGKGEEGNWICE